MSENKITDAKLAEVVGADRSAINRLRNQKRWNQSLLRIAVEIERFTEGAIKPADLLYEAQGQVADGKGQA